MQSQKRNDSNNDPKLIEKSIANAEERRKKALKDKTSLSDQELEDVKGGIGHTTGFIESK